MLPLYEAKMLHHYDHRWATYQSDGTTRDVTLAEKQQPDLAVLPRYWVREAEVDARLAGRWDRGWLLGWRDITNSTNERTTIATTFPRTGVGNKVPLMPSTGDPSSASCLQASLSSLVCDYASRQKVGGTTLNYFIYEQLPVPSPHLAAPEWDRASSCGIGWPTVCWS